MSKYVHTVNYYETDKMGVTNHSNYIRFMEEARMHFLSGIGYPMQALEAAGFTSPVVSVSCEYKHPTTFADEIEIDVRVAAYTGVRLTLEYEMRNRADQTLVAVAKSVHCFVDDKGNPIALKKHLAPLDACISSMIR